jgi:protein-tyrosine-phosphatase
MAAHQKKKVLFVCIGNACRSPMAEAIARHHAPDIIEASSAGIFPLGRLPEETEQTLQANGYPIDGLTSKALRGAAIENADLIINLSGQSLDEFVDNVDGNANPRLAPKVEIWKVEDPYGEEPVTYQRILEELETRVLLLAGRLRSSQRAAGA